MPDQNTCGDDCIDCNPGAAHLGEGVTVQPGEWTPIDDHGTEIYIYLDQGITQPVDIVVQVAGVDDEIRRLLAAFDEIGRLLDDYRGAKALREGVRSVVERVQARRAMEAS